MVVSIIKQSNGDALGTILFIQLIIFLILLENKTIYSYLLIGECIIALIVDLYFTHKAIQTYKYNKSY